MASFTLVNALVALTVVVRLTELALVTSVKVVAVRLIPEYEKPDPSLSIVTLKLLPANILTALKSRVALLLTKFCKLTNSLL